MDRTNLFLATIRWGTYFVLLTPLIISDNFYFPFVGPKSLFFMGIVEILFGAWVLLALRDKNYRPKSSPVLWALLIFVGVSIAAALAGVNFSVSFWSKFERMTGILMWFHLLAFFVILASTFKKKDEWLKIFGVSIGVAVFASLIAIGGKLGLWADPSPLGGGTLGNTSFLGTYLLFNFFLALYLFFSLRGRSPWQLYPLAGLVMFPLATILSRSDAATGSMLGGLVLLGTLVLIFKQRKTILRLAGGALLAALFIVFFSTLYLVTQPDNPARDRFVKMAGSARFATAKMSWEAFQKRPLLGWGPENFNIAFYKYYDPCIQSTDCGGSTWFDRAHNIVFDTLVTRGIIGLIFYFAIFAAAVYALWRKYFLEKQEPSGDNFWKPAIITSLFAAYIVQNLTVFDMISSFLMFMLVLGFVAYSLEGDSKPVPAAARPKLSAFLLLLLLGMFFVFIIQPARVSYETVAVNASRTIEERSQHMKKALSISPGGEEQIRLYLARASINLAKSDVGRNLPPEFLKEELTLVSEKLRDNIAENPLDFRSLFTLGKVYNVYGRLFDKSYIQKADRVLQKAIETAPTNQRGYWALAQTKLYQGDFERALELSEYALALYPNTRMSHLILVETVKIAGKEDLARQKADEALERFPDLEKKISQILNK